MPVYLDRSRNRFGRMILCHMIADTPDELHAMAKRIGMKQEWFQQDSFPHYDVSLTRKALALEAGAIELDRRDFINVVRRLRGEQ